MKVFLVIGNKDIEDALREGSYEVVDSEDNLVSLYDLIDFMELDGIVINRLLDVEGEQLSKVVKKASDKGIRVIILVDEFKEFEERKLVVTLVNSGANAFIQFKDLTADLISNTFQNYPEEFDFSMLSGARVEYREVVKSVFKETIAVFSPLSQGASTVAAHLAVALARSKSCRVCLVDYNPLKPFVKDLFGTDPEYYLNDVLDNVVKQNLSPERIESLTKQSKYQRNLDLLFGIYDLNDYYASKLEQFEEIIEKLKFTYDYVIIDTYSWCDIYTTDAALRKADRVLLPVMGTKYSIEGLNRYITMFEKYQDYDLRKFSAVINQYGQSDLTSIEIGAKLKIPVAGYIRDDKGYKRGNHFKNNKFLNDYIDILNHIGIDAKKFGRLLAVNTKAHVN